MKLKIEVTELDKEDVVNILSGFTSYSYYWCMKIDWKDAEYKLAKKSLTEKDPKNSSSICREDVWAYMLMDMKTSLILIDDEGVKHELTLEKMIKGITLSIQRNGTSVDSDDWDAEDNDIMIQNAIYDEVIYG